MKTLAQRIFNEFKEKIILPHYHPTTPVETLKARLTATWMLQHPDATTAKHAEAFIKKTSTFKQEDFDRLKQFSAQVKIWDQFHICSAYINAAGTFLEYKLSFTTIDNIKNTQHFHARYEIKDQTCYFISQTPPLIRVVGDPVLHHPGTIFPQNPTPSQQQELERQIEHAKSVLIQTSGAGIAANQCACIEAPYRFTIVGVFYDIHEHVSGVDRRYPKTKFPAAKIMVNPVITAVSTETQKFNHACLSVPCANRCEVKSPMEISVTYQDPTQNMATMHVTVKGVDAVVLWHELTHILHGKTYMDVTFESLSTDDLSQFKSMLAHELHNRNPEHHSHLPELTVPPFHFSVKVNEAGIAKLYQQELAIVLPKMTDETLAGLFNQVNQLLKKNTLINDDNTTSRGLERFSIHAAVNTRNKNKVTDDAPLLLDFS